jgi:hypothetical protein
MAFRQFEYVSTNSELLCLNLMFVYYCELFISGQHVFGGNMFVV